VADQNHDAQALARLGRALGHPIRVAVLRELNTIEVASPRLLAERLDLPLGRVAYHVRTLRGWQLLELTGTTPRRGALEHHYRLAATAQPLIRTMHSLTRFAEDPRVN
jgi:DNA-binding transcriptional ArsR family regulator